MAIIATIITEIHSIKYGKLEIWQEGSLIRYRRHYELLGADGNALPYIGKRDIEDVVEFSSLSPQLQSALALMASFTEGLIKAKEGIQ